MFRLLAGTGALLLFAAACGDDAPPVPQGSPLWSDGTHLRDAEGRVVVLRGVNARVEGVFDVTFDDGRVPLEPIPALTADDCQRMRALGIDLLRLPINWSGIEPERDQIDEDYLRRVDAAVRCAGDAGVLVVVDLHQDAYSKEIGEDGAPLWAIEPAPQMLLEGPLHDLGDRRASSQVALAFDSFFTIGDPHGLQAEFIAMLEVVAARYADDPAVIGIEIFNEPNVGQRLVEVFSAKAAAAVRAAAPGKLVFFEPPDMRNIFDFVEPAQAPFPVEGAVYSPHVYTCVFSMCPDGPTYSRLESSVAGTRTEAVAWQTPLFIGEFGIGPEVENAAYMGMQAELHDKYFASDAYWLWKEQSQGSWGLHSWDGETWSERPEVVRWISRPHAVRIAGTPVRNEYRWQEESVTVEIERGSATRAPHIIYVPERMASTFRVTCDGVSLTPSRDAASGQIEVECAGTLTVTPG